MTQTFVAGAVLTATQTNTDLANPTGVLAPFAGATAPTGWLLANGQAVSRTVYAALFAVASTTYGPGDGSTTFNLPDLRGRMPLGAGTGTGLNASGTGAPTGTAQTARTTGQWLGEETHLLSGAESGTSAHNHPVSDPGHAHGYGVIGTAQTGTGQVAPTNSFTFTQTTQSTTTGLTVSNSTAANASSRHAIIPPVVVLNYIIKT